MMNDTVIILSSVGNFRRAVKHCSKNETLVIALDESARETAIKNRYKCKSESDFLDLSELELRESSDRLSKQWYTGNGKDFSEFDECSLGSFLSVEVGYRILFGLERDILLLQGILKQTDPKKLILSTNKNSQLEHLVEEISNSINVLNVPPLFFKSMAANFNSRGLKYWLWKRGLDYYSKDIFFRIKNIRNQSPPSITTNSPKALFVVDIPNPSVLETLIPIIRKMEEDQKIVLATDPRCQSALAEYSIRSIPFNQQFLGLEIPKNNVDNSDDVDARWQELDKFQMSHGSNLVFRDIDLWPACRKELRILFKRRIPLALKHYRLANEIIQKYHVHAVVTAADTHYSGHLFVNASKNQKIYSLVVQHGMVNHSQGYLPIKATQLAVMGEAIREWCLNNGAKPEQIIVTGQPRFDSLINEKQIERDEIISDFKFSADYSTWLVTPERHLGLWMRDVLFDALLELPNTQAIIRVHPSDSPINYKLGISIRPNLLDRKTVSRKYDGASILNACDVIVLGRSTMGLEALLLGKHIIVISPPEDRGWIIPPYLKDYLSGAPFLQATSKTSLVNAWYEMQRIENSKLLDELRQKIIQRYAFKFDGKSSDRIKHVIEKQLVN